MGEEGGLGEEGGVDVVVLQTLGEVDVLQTPGEVDVLQTTAFISLNNKRL